jgi:hypothetical protein
MVGWEKTTDKRKKDEKEIEYSISKKKKTRGKNRKAGAREKVVKGMKCGNQEESRQLIYC